jgi:Na+/phosphate symporter
MTAYLSLLVALVGLVIYAVSVNPKLMEIGRLMFGSGLLAFLLQTAPRVLSVLGK